MPTLKPAPSITKPTASQIVMMFSIPKISMLAVDCQMPIRASRTLELTASVSRVCHRAWRSASRPNRRRVTMPRTVSMSVDCSLPLVMMLASCASRWKEKLMARTSA